MARRELGFRLGVFYSNGLASQLALSATLWHMRLVWTHGAAMVRPLLATLLHHFLGLSMSGTLQFIAGLSPEHVCVFTPPAPMSLSWFPGNDPAHHSTHNFLHICVPKISKAPTCEDFS